MTTPKRKKKLPKQLSTLTQFAFVNTPNDSQKKRRRIVESSESDDDDDADKNESTRLAHRSPSNPSLSEHENSDEEGASSPKMTREKASKVTKKVSSSKPTPTAKTERHEKWKDANLTAYCPQLDDPVKCCFHQFVSPKTEPNATRKMKRDLEQDRRLLCCNFCGDVLTLQVAKGLSTLKKHLAVCKGPNAKKFHHSLLVGNAKPLSFISDVPVPSTNAHHKQGKQSSLSQHVLVKNKTWYKKEKDEKRRDLLGKLTKWVVMRSEPFSHVEDEHFRDILDLFDSNVPVFAAETIKNNIVSLSLKFKVILKDDLKTETMSLTTDHWTSPDGRSYCALTAHWIDSKFDLKSIVLGIFLYNLEDSRSKSLLQDFLIQIFNEFGFEELNVFSCVSDTTASVNKFGMMLIGLGIDHIYCTDHVIQLTAILAFDDKQYVLCDDDEELDDLPLKDLRDDSILDKHFSVLKKARSLVRYFKKSTANMDKLRILQRSVETTDDNQRELQLVNDVVTRWWATLDMIERLLRHKPALLALFATSSANLEMERALSDYDWKVLELISSVLKPFRTAQRFLEGQKYVTSSSVPVMIAMIRRRLTEYKKEKEDTGGVSSPADQAVLKLVNKMLNDLNERWRSSNNKFSAEVERGTSNRQTGIHPRLWAAHYFDPRFKSLEYLSRGAERTTEEITSGRYTTSFDTHDKRKLKSYVENCLVLEARQWRKERGEPETSDSDSEDDDNFGNTQSEAKKSDLAVLREEFSLMSNMRSGDQTQTTAVHVRNSGLRDIVREEMQRYDMKSILAPQKNPLHWWKKYQTSFPIMSRFARKVLAIPATSAPSERVFSYAERFFGKLRQHVNPNMIIESAFLRSAIQLYGEKRLHELQNN